MTTIYFATNRLLLPPDNPDVFGKGFSEDGLANLRFGRAEVTGVDFNEFEIYVEPENLTSDPAERRLGSRLYLSKFNRRCGKKATLQSITIT